MTPPSRRCGAARPRSSSLAALGAVARCSRSRFNVAARATPRRRRRRPRARARRRRGRDGEVRGGRLARARVRRRCGALDEPRVDLRGPARDRAPEHVGRRCSAEVDALAGGPRASSTCRAATSACYAVPVRARRAAPGRHGGRRAIAGRLRPQHASSRSLGVARARRRAARCVGVAARWMPSAARCGPVARDDRRRPTGASTTSAAASAPAPRPTSSTRARRGRSTRCSTASRPSLRHEQRFSAELSHELRTPLARIAAEARARCKPRALARGAPRGATRVVARSAAQMGETSTTLMAAARAEAQLGPGRSDARRRPGRIASGWTRRSPPSATSSSSAPAAGADDGRRRRRGRRADRRAAARQRRAATRVRA